MDDTRGRASLTIHHALAALLVLDIGLRLGAGTIPAATPGAPPAAVAPADPAASAAAAAAAPTTEPAARRCAATTRRGSQCSRKSEPGSSFCWQHQGR